MKRLWTAALAGVLALGAASTAMAQQQPPSQDELQSRRDKKVAEAWFVDGGWTADYDAARKMATDSGKPIFAYFTRSYSP